MARTHAQRLLFVVWLLVGCGQAPIGNDTNKQDTGADSATTGTPDQTGTGKPDQMGIGKPDLGSTADTLGSDQHLGTDGQHPTTDATGADLAIGEVSGPDGGINDLSTPVDAVQDSTTSADANVAPDLTTTADVVQAKSNLSAVWANNGQDKVARGELRKSKGGAVTNSVWNGTAVTLFGARNETVAFNLVLEAANATVSAVSVQFLRLDGPNQSAIVSKVAANSEGLWNWVERPIELFYVRYLQIKGLSVLAYESYYDERHAPKRFRRPYDQYFAGQGDWTDRPDHDKFYPEIAVPLELHPTFAVQKGQNQSIWVDIYIPKGTPAGLFKGAVTVSEAGKPTRSIPVELTVRGFTLPDRPTGKTMAVLGTGDVFKRYGVDDSGAGQARGLKIHNRHHMIAHRHRISLVGDGANDVSLPARWVDRLNGSLYTKANGYAGPGAGVGNDIYPIGLYGSWTYSWDENSASDMQSKATAWVSYFEANFPDVLFFLYLIDEPPASKFAQIEQWSQWIDQSSGAGKRMPTFSTIPLTTAASKLPNLDMPCTWTPIGITESWENAVTTLKNKGRKLCMYNGHRPASGTFATEDDGVALRVLAWTQFKKQIDFWFLWETTYYNDFQATGLQTNVFKEARTFGGKTTFTDRGEQGWNYTNGDGVLFYPGTDKVYPEVSYDADGPFVSLRMKLWRRGLQDMDYLALAQKINPAAVATIINQIIPKVLWEYGVNDPNDPTWVKTDISWSIDPDVWEAARKQLADIIESK